MKKDTQYLLGGLAFAGLAGLAYHHFSMPASQRAGVGDKVYAGVTVGPITATLFAQILAVSPDNKEVQAMVIDSGSPLNGQAITFPRSNILSMAN